MPKRARRGLVTWLVTAFVLAISVVVTPTPARADTGGYPYADYNGPGTDASQSLRTASNGGWYSPYKYVYRNCTDYVAWKLATANGWTATNSQGTIISMGHAKAWGGWATANGYTVDKKPAVGSVAWWDTGDYGHVTYVESISADGNTVTISEYNRAWDGKYGTRNITKGAPTGYIHFKDGGGSSGSGGGSSPPPPPTPHLFEAFHWNTNSGMTEVRQLNASNNFTTWSGGWTTPDGWHGGDTTDYGMADANSDGVQDLYVILYCCTGSGMTEVKILNGASNFTQWVGGWVTADSYHTPGTVRYAVGNFDGDTKPDVYVIPTNNTPSGKVEVKVLTGVSNFSQWAGGWVTPDGWHDSNGVDFVLSTCGATGRPHLYEILHENTNSGMTEVRQFDGATSYTTFVGGWTTPDGAHSGDHVAYTVGGCNPNGKPNIYIIAHSHTNSGMTEVKVLNGTHNFTQWVGGWVTPDGWHSGFDIDYVMPLS